MDWIKDWTDSDNHPQMVAAGFWGRTVFRFLCRLSGSYDLNGAIPPGYLRGEFIAPRLGIEDVTGRHDEAVTVASRAVTRLRDVGLIRIVTTDGSAVIPGWDNRQQRSMSAAQRSAKYRETLKVTVTKPSRRVTRSVTLDVEREVEREVESKDSRSDPVSAPPKPPISKPAEVVFRHYLRATGQDPSLAMAPSDWSLLGQAFKFGFTQAQLEQAADGVAVDCRRWPERKAQMRLAQVYGSADQIRQFVSLATSTIRPKNGNYDAGTQKHPTLGPDEYRVEDLHNPGKFTIVKVPK